MAPSSNDVRDHREHLIDVPTNGHHSASPPPRATPSPLPTTPSVNSISLSVSPQIHSAALPSSPQPDTPQMSDAPMKKQKLPLKGFAAKKKRMREAEEAAKAAIKEKANAIPENTRSEFEDWSTTNTQERVQASDSANPQ
ncbi:hypothetical protein V5O48_012722 [Marasmius crinis-equi]|uniref:Uncharacterized protein n=1 Tax=Marasmius crinis-equi TaxID=585013 RepID=A0ABR3F2A8_9AGAR